MYESVSDPKCQNSPCHLEHHHVDCQCLLVTRTNTFDHKIDQCEIIDSDHLLIPSHTHLHGNQSQCACYLQDGQGQRADITDLELGIADTQQASVPVEPVARDYWSISAAHSRQVQNLHNVSLPHYVAPPTHHVPLPQ